jgi:hypothetical protein
MAAKKTVVKGARKATGKVAKKAASKGGKPKATPSGPCVDSPKKVFTEIEIFARGMKDWATDDGDIEGCFQKYGGCGTPKRRKRLLKLCGRFAEWARDVADWANEVEACWADGCKEDGGPNHTAPPPPPF